MESTEESVQEYTEPDGTKVIKKTIITRIRSSGHKSGSGSSSSHFLSNSGRLGASAASSPSRTSTLNYADPKTLNEFEKAFLNKHNEYRKLHGVPALQMSKEVNKRYIKSLKLNYFCNVAVFLRPRVGSQHCQQGPVVASSQ